MSRSHFPPTLVLVALYVAIGNGCGVPTVRFRTYPPDATVRLDGAGTCSIPCDLPLHTKSTGKPLPYRIEKSPLYHAKDGTLEVRRAPGCIVGAVFTLGIVAAAKDGCFYFPPAQSQLQPINEVTEGLEVIQRSGKGRVEGQAFTKTRGGEIRHAAGDTVTIRPNTPYVYDALRFLAFQVPPSEGTVTSNPDLTFLDTFRRQTIADAEGRFAFDGLAPGDYVITAAVTWDAPGAEGVVQQRVDVVGFADLREKQMVKTLVVDWTAQRLGPNEAVRIPPLSDDVKGMGQQPISK